MARILAVSGHQTFHNIVGDFEIRENGLHVIVVFEKIDQLDDRLGGFLAHRCGHVRLSYKA